MINLYTKSIFITLFFGVFILFEVSGQCPLGDIEIKSEYDLNKFNETFPNCSEINGNLEIYAFINSSTPLLSYDLSFLNNIESVDGDVIINNLDLSGYDILFPLLERVKGDIELSYVTVPDGCSFFPALDTIPGELSLRAIRGKVLSLGPKVIQESLYIRYLETINDLDFIRNCDYIPAVSIYNCPNLTDISHLDSLSAKIETLAIGDCTSLSNCDIEKICELVTTDESKLTLENNGEECSYKNLVKTQCTGIDYPCAIEEIIINSNEDLIKYQEVFGNCDHIEGDLIIQSFAVADSLLDSFNSLIRISGQLKCFSTNFKDLSIFGNVEEIGSVFLNYCSDLESLKGLDKLSKLESLLIANCGALSSINAISFVDELQLKKFEVNYCPMIDFSNLEFKIKDLDEFSLRSLPISHIDNFNSLEKVDHFSIVDLVELELLEFSPSFHPANITISYNANLLSVTNLSLEITSLESLNITSGHNDSDYSAFDHIKNITDQLLIESYPRYANWDFPSLTDINKLIISGTSNTVHPYFPSLINISRLEVKTNRYLKSLNSFKNVEQIDTIVLSNNKSLEDISAITPDKGLKSLHVLSNINVPTCAIEAVCNRSEDFDLKISGWRAGCRNIQEVDLECEGKSNIIFRDLELRTQGAVDSLLIKYSSIDTIYGDLSIYGNASNVDDPITDLSPLSNLVYLNGLLRINQIPSGLLESLKSVKFHNLIITNSNIPLQLPEFENVDSLLFLIINNTDTIISDVVFPNLKYCKAILIEYINHMSGSFKFPVLEEECDMRFTDSSFDYVHINKLDSIGNLNISGCYQFKGFKNCQNLKYVRELRLSHNNSLEAIFDFATIKYIPQVLLSHIDGIKELKGLENVESIGRLSIYECESLEKLNFPTLTVGRTDLTYNGDGISIAGNPNLTSINFPKLEITTSLRIIRNPSLTILNGFPKLTELNSLALKDNDILENLDSLNQNLTVLNLIEIQNNPKLNLCGNQIICDHLTVSKPFSSFGNSLNCSGEIDFKLSCGLEIAKCPENDVILKNNKDIEQYYEYYNSCTEIDGNLGLSSELITHDITFDSLISINGRLSISDISNPIKIDFKELEFINSELYIKDNSSPFELYVSKLLQIGRSISIQDNINLEQLSNLKIRTNKPAKIYVRQNADLNSLDFLSEIDIFENLSISENPALKSLGELNPNALISRLYVSQNESLTTCDVPIICNNLESGYFTSFSLWGNADPCDSEQVRSSCLGTSNVIQLDKGEINIYPNPVHSELYINYPHDIKELNIYSISGELLLKNQEKKSIDLSSLEQGNYFLQVLTSSSQIAFHIIKI